MAEVTTPKVWINRTVFLLVAFVLIVIQLVPP